MFLDSKIWIYFADVEKYIHTIDKDVLERLPLKVAEVVVSPVPDVVVVSADLKRPSKILKKRHVPPPAIDVYPPKGSWVEVKYVGEGWCKGVVKKVTDDDSAMVYFNCDKSTQTVNWKSMKWRWV